MARGTGGSKLKDLVREAADPHTPASRLEALFEEGGRHRRRRSGNRDDPSPLETALAGNPNTPPQILRYLATTAPVAVAHNPALPLLLIVEPDFFHDLPRTALGELLRSADTPVFVLRTLNSRRNPDLARAVNQHVQIRGEAGENWREEIAEELERLPIRANAACCELVELGLAPERVLRALGESSAYSSRRWLLAAAVRSPAAAEIAAFLERASGCSRLRHIHAPNLGLDLEEIRRLAHGGPWAQAIVARYPDSPPELLARVATHRDPLVRTYAAGNRAAPAEALARLAADPKTRIRVRVARNECCPPPLLAELARDPSPRVRAAVARHPHAGGELLEALATDPDTVVRIAVRRHPNTPEHCRETLAVDPAVEPSTEESGPQRPGRHAPILTPVLDRLLFPAPPGKRKRGVGTSGLTPTESALPEGHPASASPEGPAPPPRDPKLLLRWLQAGPSELECTQATGKLPFALREVLLRRDPHPWQVEARRHIAADPEQSAEVLTILAEHYLPTVRARVGGNPACPAEVLEVLARQEAFPIQERLAANPRVTGEMQLELARSNKWEVAQRLLTNPKLVPGALEVLSRHADYQVRAKVARHRCSTPALLIQLAGDTHRDVRRAVAGSPRAPAEAFERMIGPALSDAAGDEDPLCRWIALCHPQIPAERLGDGAYSPRGHDRLAVAHNPAVPDAIRVQLSGDGLALVRAAARATMGEQEVDSQS